MARPARPQPRADPAGSSAPLRVLFLDSIESWGGGEKWCVETARALCERGHEVAIACAPGSALERRAREAELEVFSRTSTGPSALVAGLALGSYLRERRIEVVVANVGRDLRLGAVACARAGIGTHLVQRRGILRPLKRDPLAVWLYRHAVARVVANCAAIRTTMLACADFADPARFVVIPNAIDTRREPRGDPARLRRELDLGPSPCGPIVGVIGRLAAMKGHASLLAAWPAVLARIPTARLVLAGEGDQETALRRSAEAQGLGSSVVFLGFRRDLEDVFAALDLFVLPSIRDEGCNNTLLEAMWHGRAAVVTRCGGLPEQVVDGETGRVVGPGDEAALAEAIAGLLERPDEIARMGAAARMRVRERHALERVIGEWERLCFALRDER